MLPSCVGAKNTSGSTGTSFQNQKLTIEGSRVIGLGPTAVISFMIDSLIASSSFRSTDGTHAHRQRMQADAVHCAIGRRKWSVPVGRRPTREFLAATLHLLLRPIRS